MDPIFETALQKSTVVRFNQPATMQGPAVKAASGWNLKWFLRNKMSNTGILTIPRWHSGTPLRAPLQSSCPLGTCANLLWCFFSSLSTSLTFYSSINVSLDISFDVIQYRKTHFHIWLSWLVLLVYTIRSLNCVWASETNEYFWSGELSAIFQYSQLQILQISCSTLL